MSRATLTPRGAATAVLTGACLGLALLVPGPAAADDDGPNEDALEGVTDVVVKLAPTQPIAEITTRYDARVVDSVTAVRTYLIAPPARTTPVQLVEALANDGGLQLEWVEPNYADGQPEGNPTYKWSGGTPTVVGQDPAAWRNQVALRTLGVASAHRATRGAGTVVAVVDTGFRLGHPALAGRLTSSGYDFVEDDRDPAETLNRRDDDADGAVDEGRGHGTHVAGVVAAVAPEARIMPLRVLDDEGMGFVWTTAEAIRWATERDADVINLSLGTVADSDLLEEAVESAEEEGEVVVVASAGNDQRSTPQYPAADDDAVAVASVTPTDVRSPFSNVGAWVDLAAPGQRIVSAFPATAYARWDGTSMAAPFVAGQAALLRAQRPGAEVDAVVTRIRQTAVAVGSGLGAGRIDVAASIWR